MIEFEIKKAIRNIPDFPKKGIDFKDITPILLDAELCNNILNEFVERLKGQKFDYLCAIESRGFFFGTLLANKLQIPFVPIRKEGKLPGDTARFHYDLEYGSATIEIHKDLIRKGANILLHDDLLATGGTAYAASELIKSLGANVGAVSFLVNLSFLDGKKKLEGITNNIFYLAEY
jgi:adenine phosphoribosyltransferase